MSEDAKYKCDWCGSKTGGDDGFIYCPYCGEPYDAEGYEPSHPLPCVRDEHGEIKRQTVKQLFAKIDEELNEFKAAVLREATVRNDLRELANGVDDDTNTDIADEAADVIAAITSLEEALGVDAEMRDEAQRRVNAKNRERNRL